MRKVLLRYKTEELFADLSVRCGIAADAASLGGRDVHNTRDVLDDGNREVLENTLSRLMYECTNILYPFCKTPVRGGVRVNDIDETECYEVEMVFPYERSETEVEEMRRTLQEYVVLKCLAEWLALTLPDTGQWQTWETKAQETRDRLATVLVLPMRPRTLRVRPRFY